MSVKVEHRQGIVSSSPIYYGWVVWFVAMIGVMATSPGQSFYRIAIFRFFHRRFRARPYNC